MRAGKTIEAKAGCTKVTQGVEFLRVQDHRGWARYDLARRYDIFLANSSRPHR
jgi:hypothetical protein